MIAFLCSTLDNGRERILQQPLTAGLWLRVNNTLWTGAGGKGACVGFLASRQEHLIGKEISGYALLDQVDPELVSYALPRLRKTMAGALWPSR